METFELFLKGKDMTQEAFKALDVDKQADLFNEFNEANTKAFKVLSDDVKSTKEEIKKANDELRAIQAEQVKQLNESLKKLGVEIKRIKESEAAKEPKLNQDISKHLLDNLEKLKASKNGSMSDAQNNAFSFETKALTIGGSISGGNVPVEDRIDGLNEIPSRRIRLIDIMAKRSTISGVVSWVFQNNKTGSAGATGEGLIKNEIDFEMVVASESVKKYTAFIKASTEMLDDVTWIEQEIRNELMRELEKSIEQDSYDGDGIGINLLGIVPVAAAFDPGVFANAVDNANAVDVLVVAIDQIMIAMEGKATPNWILMFPSDVTRLKLEKVTSTDKRYVERLMIVGSTLMLDGVPIIPTTLVAPGDYLVGDFQFSFFTTRQGIRIDIGLTGDDFINNMRTILSEWRGLVFIKDNDTDSFVAGDFATDTAALETA